MARYLCWAASVLLVLHWAPFCDLKEMIQCPETSECFCRLISAVHTEMHCPVTDYPNFMIVISDEKNVEIRCRTGTIPSEYSVLNTFPPFNIYGLEFFSLSKCPLEDEIPFSEIIDRFGKHTDVKYFTFEKGYLVNKLRKAHLTGLEELIHLDLAENSITHLPDEFFAGMNNLITLILRSNKISLNADLFRSSHHISKLDLSQNGISSIPERLFHNLKSLKHLSLKGNSLTHLENDTFQDLNLLEELDLSSNELTILPSNVFQYLSNLKILHIYSNYFHELPKQLFAKNEKLSALKLLYNNYNLKELPNGFLSNLNDLEKVELNNCGIEILPMDLFWESRNIEYISLKGNMLRDIPKSLLRHQDNLIDLDLSDNFIRSIPNETFRQLDKLQKLNLENNSLVIISRNILRHLRSLETLKLRENRLKEIVIGSLPTSLKFLDLSYNNLTFMDNECRSEKCQSPLNELKSLEELILSHNSITKIYSDWKNKMIHLNELDLSYNSLTEIKTQNINFTSSTINVDLRNNNISMIYIIDLLPFLEPSNLKYLSRRTVMVENNPIHCNCFIYDFIVYLHDLAKDESIISTLRIELGSLSCSLPPVMVGKLVKNLKPDDIICSLNDYAQMNQRLPKCPQQCICNVRQHDMTLIIDCSSSNLVETPHIPDEYHIFNIELNFENNALKKLPVFSNKTKIYNKIRKMYVSGNNISQLSVENIPNSIKKLDLRRNQLSYINSTITNKLIGLKSLDELWISANTFKCDCENHFFFSFINTNVSKVKDLSNATCSDGRSISLLDLENLCGISAGHIALNFLMAGVGIFLGLLLALFYKYQHRIKVKLFAKGLCLKWVTEEDVDKNKLYDAFISFSHKDEDFIVEKLVSELENGPNAFKLCLHFRDWVAGETITSQIATSIEQSKRTVVVLSANFMESVWGIMEFRTAHSNALKEGRVRVIVILYGDIGPIESLEPELKAYLNMNTYIRWDDPCFWDRLRYALPHHSQKHNKSVKQAVFGKRGFEECVDFGYDMSTCKSSRQTTQSSKHELTDPMIRPFI